MSAGLSMTSSARTWHIFPDGSGDARTIQAGIDSASVGDTVVAGCGTYYEFGIAMRSGVCLRGETGDPDCAVIDGQGRGWVVNCTSVDNTGILEALTITGGHTEGNGGGIICKLDCFVVIMNCVIRDNRAGWGGGIGMDCSSSPTIRDCTIYGNSAFYPYEYAGSGGGIYVCGWYTEPEISGCTILGNSAVGGGGIACDIYAGAHITDCVIAGNTATASGGGIECGTYATPVFVGCTIAGNRAPRGGGLDSYRGSVTMDRSIVWGNCAGLIGDEMRLWGVASTLTVSCSAIDTTGIEGDGVITWEEGNVFSDPLFCDPEDCESAPTTQGDYTLSSSSPCLSAPGCGQIGALGLGCSGPTAVERTSWGAIKTLFR